MSKLCERNICTGCMACYNVCPFDAITINENDLGILVPDIQEDKCKNCEKCTVSCPMLNQNNRNTPEIAYALYTKDENDRKTCASGGVATTLSRSVIKSGGVVFGSGFDEDGTPVFKKATKQEELEEFKGSKYVYVFPGLIYREVLEELKSGKQCLFVGTPCQIDGLKGFLRTDYENLMTVDLICHGTPPFSYLKESVEEIGLSKYSYFSFRGKHDYKFTVYSVDGKIIYSKPIDEDVYFSAFSSSISLRECCTSCPYSCNKRVSDITIGDFWGISKDALNGYKGKISVALPNTDKGMSFLKSGCDNFVYETRDVTEAFNGNPKLSEPAYEYPERKRFVTEYKNTKSFCESCKRIGLKKTVLKNRIKNVVLMYPRIIIRKFLRL